MKYSLFSYLISVYPYLFYIKNAVYFDHLNVCEKLCAFEQSVSLVDSFTPAFSRLCRLQLPVIAHTYCFRQKDTEKLSVAAP